MYSDFPYFTTLCSKSNNQPWIWYKWYDVWQLYEKVDCLWTNTQSPICFVHENVGFNKNWFWLSSLSLKDFWYHRWVWQLHRGYLEVAAICYPWIEGKIFFFNISKTFKMLQEPDLVRLWFIYIYEPFASLSLLKIRMVFPFFCQKAVNSLKYIIE